MNGKRDSRIPPFGAGLLGILALTVITILTPSLAFAQDVSYTTLTKGEFAGTLGTMMKLVPGAGDPIVQKTFIKGSLMRTDDEDTSTIMDMGEGRYTYLDHPSKTYFSMTLAEMQLQAQAGLAEAMDARPTAESEAADTPPEDSVTFDVKLTTDRTGRKQDFGGYSAEQVLMTVEVVPKVTGAKATSANDEPTEAGTLVLLTELWLSNDFPGQEALQEAETQMGRELMESEEGTALAQAFASDPKMGEAFKKSAEEMKGMGGTAVKTVSYFVMVAPGAEFDPDPVLAVADQPLSEGMGSAVAGAATEGAKGALRGALSRRTGGLLGRRNQEPEPEAAGPTQAIVMRVTSTVEDVSTGSLSEDLFKPPVGYTEQQPDWIKGGGEI